MAKTSNGAPGGAKAVSRPVRTPIHALTAGVVSKLLVDAGDAVTKGTPLLLVEVMKMQHEVTAPCGGKLLAFHVSEGEAVAEGQKLAVIAGGGGDERDEPAASDDVLGHGPSSGGNGRIRSDLAEVQSRHAILEDSARPEAISKRRARGQQTARENIAALFDPGSFIEYGALAVAAQRRRFAIDELQSRSPADGIITGLGTVNADMCGQQNTYCAGLAVDYTVMAGTQGFFHHKKLDRILELATDRKLPVVTFAEGGGGRPNDVDAEELFFSGLDVSSFRLFGALSGTVPRVTVVSGYCFAGNAAFAGAADVLIATRNANIGMGGPAMIEGGGLGVVEPEDVGPAEDLSKAGVIDLLVADEREAAAMARNFLGFFQGARTNWSARPAEALRDCVPLDRLRVYDMRACISSLFDEASVLELRRDFGIGIITCFARIEGRPLGVIANNPAHLGGAIDPDAADKAARFLQLCDAFGIAVVSLCDTPGFMVGPEIERRAQVRHVSRMLVTGANLSVPLFTVILRKGYGLGAQAMAGGSFRGPLFTIAWPTGEFGAMGLEGAIRLGARRELEAIDDPQERERKFRTLVTELYQKGKALNVGSLLEFDAVIDPADTRRWLLAGLNAAGPVRRGSRGFVDTW